MQHAVERDEQGRSNYTMCAVNPSRVGKTSDDAALREIVDTTSNGRDRLLEIVNFNVEVRIQVFMSLLTDMIIKVQYVCAGELVALLTLTNVLNYLQVQKVDITKVRLTGLLTLSVLTINPADRQILSRKS